MNIKPTNPRVGIKYVEQRFGKHRNTLRRWVERGKFPPPDYDPSGYQTWFLDVIEDWEAENYHKTNPHTENIDAANASRHPDRPLSATDSDSDPQTL